jgi:glycosyltransferase involved in cell wall biosynthesis
MITLISTVYNCKDEIRDTIEYFLCKDNNSLYDQIIICDGGSTDGTIELLKEFSHISEKVIILEAHEANISRGRNIAINAAKDGVIVAFDSGTTYSKDWLKKMTDPIISGDFEIVEGNSILTGNNKFQKIICNIIDNDKEGPRQGASHRCISYKKLVWETVGGYPENVKAGEDTWFNSVIRKNNFRIKFDETATCFWTVRKNLPSYIKMIYRNISGHIQLKGNLGTTKLFVTAMINVLMIAGLVFSIFSKYIFAVTIILMLIYFSYRLLKPPRYKYFYRPDHFFYGVFILFITDFTVTRAFANKLFGKKKGNHE